MSQSRRVLILEDEFLVAMDLEGLISEMGHQVVASLTRVGEAIKFSNTAEIDFAILDLNLRGEKSFPVAEVLRGRGIPFVFASGYGSDGLSAGFENERVIQKPYGLPEIRQVVEDIFRGG